MKEKIKTVSREEHQASYASWSNICMMLTEIIDLAEITEQKPCEYIGNGALKKRGKGFVCYNVEWFKKHWRQELDLMGIELEADKADQEAATR